MIDHYILHDGTPVPEPNILTWGQWYEMTDRSVARTELYDGVVCVSTVFLGLDYNFLGSGPPILYETMIFADGLDCDEYQDRYATRIEAETGHEIAVIQVRHELSRRCGMSRDEE